MSRSRAHQELKGDKRQIGTGVGADPPVNELSNIGQLKYGETAPQALDGKERVTGTFGAGGLQ